VSGILELGLDTFGDVTLGKRMAIPRPTRKVIRKHRRRGPVLADELGVDFIGLGEHHRADFCGVPRRKMVLAAIAGRTKRIRLGSAVTVLSSDDSDQGVFQRFFRRSTQYPAGRARDYSGAAALFTESFSVVRLPTQSI